MRPFLLPMATNTSALVARSRNRVGVSLRPALLAVLLGAGFLSHAGAQTSNGAVASASVLLPPNAAKVPFFVGEKLDYEVRFWSFRVGSGSLEVLGIEDVRGRPSYHATFKYSGNLASAKVNDSHETWFDVETLASRRFHQDIDNPGYDRVRRFEIFPERGMFKENDKPEEPTTQNPLDDAAFLYFVRTLPLEVGKTYEFSRYFKAQGNPVKIKVLRKERVKVPAGEFSTIVVQPVIRSKGLFSEGGKAEVWITDDARRMMVQLKSKVSIGSINLYLKAHNTTAPK
ncbi:MAG: DUF3108 domain-containing protein [Gemmatimonas sp.]